MLKYFLNSPIFNTWFSNLVILISSLISIPIVITKLSVEEVNVWFLLYTIVSLGQSILFGFNGTFVRFVAYSYAGVSISEFRSIKHKTECKYGKTIEVMELEQIFALMKNVYLYLSVGFFCLLLMVGYFGLQKPISALSAPAYGWIASGVVLVSSTIILSLGYFRVFLEGIGKVPLVQRILGVVNLLGLFLIIGVLLTYPTLLSIVIVYQTVLLTASIMIAILAMRDLRHLTIEGSRRGFDATLFSLVWESAWKSGVTTVIAGIVRHISAILVAQWFSPLVSASYQFTKRLFDVLENFTMTTFQARIPQIAKLRSRGAMNELLPYLKQTHRIAYFVFLSGFFVLLFLGEELLELIGSNVALGSRELVILFAMSTFLSRWGGMTLSVANQSNYVVEHINAFIIVLVYFPIVLLLYRYVGVEIFPLAHLLALLVTVPVIAKQVYPTIKSGFWTYEKDVLFPAFLIMAIVNFGVYWGGR